MEKWDAYLANGHKTNHILIRGQSIPDGFYHLAVKCLVQHLDGSLLFMQRHLDKKLFPGFFEASAAGSALYGENSEQAIRRELLEETGCSCGLSKRPHNPSRWGNHCLSVGY